MRRFTLLIMLFITNYIIAGSYLGDRAVFGDNERLKRFYIPQFVKTMSSHEARRKYYGVRSVKVQNYVRLNRAHVLFKDKAYKYMLRGGFGKPISRKIPYLGIIDEIPKFARSSSKNMDIILKKSWIKINKWKRIYVVNFKKYRKMNMAWKYHDMLVYGANQRNSHGTRDISAPLIGLNSREARLLRFIAWRTFKVVWSLLLVEKVINKGAVIITNRCYNRYKDKLRKYYKGNITKLFLSVMDRAYSDMPTRVAAAYLNWEGLYIGNSKNHGLGSKYRLDPSKVKHLPVFNEGGAYVQLYKNHTLKVLRNQLASTGRIKTLYLKGEGLLTRSRLRRIKKAIFVSHASVHGSEIATFNRIALELGLYKEHSFLALLVELFGVQELKNNAEFIAKKLNADAVIPESIGGIKAFKELAPHVKTINMVWGFNRLIRASGGTAWLWFAALEASRYVRIGGRVEIIHQIGRSLRNSTYSREQESYIGGIVNTLHSTPITIPPYNIKPCLFRTFGNDTMYLR